jgi:nucleoside-diphosphate-sugar epimerase
MDMLRAFSDAGGKRYVCAGTCAEYEWSTDTYDEASSAADPSTLYGKSKLAVHDLATAAGTQLNLSTATGRIFFAYGPFENASRIIPYTCRMLSLGAPALFTSGNLERDFVHVRDAGEGFAALIDSELTGAVNIASGTGVKLGTIVAKLGKIAGSEGLIELGARPDRPDDPPKMVAHIDRILSTGWRPSVSLDQGLADTFHWWKRQSTTNI